MIVAIAILVLAAGVVLTMVLFGWRFTYAPDLENSWDAISAVASWSSVVVSIIAVCSSFAAVWFAIRVADKQNKIAVFDKRMECYLELQKHRTFATMSMRLADPERVLCAFSYTFSNGVTNDIGDINLLALSLKSETIIEQLPFIFDFVTYDEAAEIKNLFSAVTEVFMAENINLDEYKDVLINYYDGICGFELKHGKSVLNYMKL